jgi:hypothetical protein
MFSFVLLVMEEECAWFSVAIRHNILALHLFV